MGERCFRRNRLCHCGRHGPPLLGVVGESGRAMSAAIGVPALGLGVHNRTQDSSESLAFLAGCGRLRAARPGRRGAGSGPIARHDERATACGAPYATRVA